jgi:hypothetical protein
VLLCYKETRKGEGWKREGWIAFTSRHPEGCMTSNLAHVLWELVACARCMLRMEENASHPSGPCRPQHTGYTNSETHNIIDILPATFQCNSQRMLHGCQPHCTCLLPKTCSRKMHEERKHKLKTKKYLKGNHGLLICHNNRKSSTAELRPNCPHRGSKKPKQQLTAKTETETQHSPYRTTVAATPRR